MHLWQEVEERSNQQQDDQNHQAGEQAGQLQEDQFNVLLE